MKIGRIARNVGLAWLTLLTGAPLCRAAVLSNENMRVTISDTGCLKSVENLLAAENYQFRSDTFELDTDRGVFSNSSTQPTVVTADKDCLVYHYVFGPLNALGAGAIAAELTYMLPGHQGFFRRALRIVSPTPLRVNNLMLGNTVFLQAPAALRVTINLPPEQIKHVMYFESGFGWMGQHPLEYDRDLLCWTAMVQPGPRASIQENEAIYVWATGSDGLRSEYYPVKVGWDFTPQPNP
ncbi:MAG: hypothetical protein ACYC3X_21310 [Pirellulaceae bacterium]